MSSIRISNNEARSRRRCFFPKFLRIRRNQWRIASRRCRGEDSPRCHGSFAIRVSRHASTNASNNSICIRAASSRTIPRGSFVSIRRGLPRRVALHRIETICKTSASIREENKAVDGMAVEEVNLSTGRVGFRQIS